MATKLLLFALAMSACKQPVSAQSSASAAKATATATARVRGDVTGLGAVNKQLAGYWIPVVDAKAGLHLFGRRQQVSYVSPCGACGPAAYAPPPAQPEPPANSFSRRFFTGDELKKSPELAKAVGFPNGLPPGVTAVFNGSGREGGAGVESETKDERGNIVISYRDGESSVISFDGKQATRFGADGRLIQATTDDLTMKFLPDGSRESTFKDGTKLKTNAQNQQTWVDKDGKETPAGPDPDATRALAPATTVAAEASGTVPWDEEPAESTSIETQPSSTTEVIVPTAPDDLEAE